MFLAPASGGALRAGAAAEIEIGFLALTKLEGNRTRDERNKRALAKTGWKVLTIWECEVKDTKRIGSVIRSFLDA